MAPKAQGAARRLPRLGTLSRLSAPTPVPVVSHTPPSGLVDRLCCARSRTRAVLAVSYHVLGSSCQSTRSHKRLFPHLSVHRSSLFPCLVVHIQIDPGTDHTVISTLLLWPVRHLPVIAMGLKDRLGVCSRETTDADAGATTTTGAEILPSVSANHDPDRELRRFRKQHKWDPFLDIDMLDNIDDALASGNAEKEAAIDRSLIQEDSPYPEVRASVGWLPELFLDRPVSD